MIPSFEFRYLPCTACTENDFSVDGKCPAAKCSAHTEKSKAAMASRGTDAASQAAKQKYSDSELKAEETKRKEVVDLRIWL